MDWRSVTRGIQRRRVFADVSAVVVSVWNADVWSSDCEVGRERKRGPAAAWSGGKGWCGGRAAEGPIIGARLAGQGAKRDARGITCRRSNRTSCTLSSAVFRHSREYLPIDIRHRRPNVSFPLAAPIDPPGLLPGQRFAGCEEEAGPGYCVHFAYPQGLGLDPTLAYNNLLKRGCNNL